MSNDHPKFSLSGLTTEHARALRDESTKLFRCLQNEGYAEISAAMTPEFFSLIAAIDDMANEKPVKMDPRLRAIFESASTHIIEQAKASLTHQGLNMSFSDIETQGMAPDGIYALQKFFNDAHIISAMLSGPAR